MKNFFNKTVLILAGILFISLAQAKVISVSVLDSSFTPANFTANVGDTIKWQWVAGNHTTTARSIPLGAATWDNPINASSTVYEYVITKPGTYNYWCAGHTTMEASFIATSAAIEPIAGSANGFALVYPIPEFQVLDIRLANYHYSSDLIVTDLMGKEISRETLTGADNTIDLSKWEKGIYFFKLNSGPESINGKFEVQ